ncbi:MAG: hypothetical protein ACYTG0_35135 [Planctomycetota bacterium]|jgi:hypothetical protein
MCEQSQAILAKPEKAAGENTPIHAVEQELVEDLRTLGTRRVPRICVVIHYSSFSIHHLQPVGLRRSLVG